MVKDFAALLAEDPTDYDAAAGVKAEQILSEIDPVKLSGHTLDCIKDHREQQEGELLLATVIAAAKTIDSNVIL